MKGIKVKKEIFLALEGAARGIELRKISKKEICLQVIMD
jgi:hypothetical protein